MLLAAPSRPSPKSELDQAIAEFQSETARITEAPRPWFAQSLVQIIVAMIVVAITAASVLKVERVVVANGRVATAAPRLLVQALDTSIVRSINVHEAQFVHRGDLLATLDPTFQSADLTNLNNQSNRLLAEIDRLEAEQAGGIYQPARLDDDSAQQLTLFHSRHAEYLARLQDFDQKIATTKATIARSREDAEHYRNRLGLITEVEDMRRELEKSKVGSRLNTLIASDTRVEVARGLSLALNTLNGAQHEMQSAVAARDVFLQQWKGEITKDLVSRRADLERVEAERAKAQRRKEMVDLRAVSDGTVLEVGRFSEGSVVQSGDQLMSFVPTNSPMVVDADIAAIDQGFIAAGQEVNLKFAAYHFIEHGMGHGRVMSISADSFAPQETRVQLQNRYYRARIEVLDTDLRNVPKDFHLVPGMTLEANIVVGQRSVISYVIETAISPLSEGFREP